MPLTRSVISIGAMNNFGLLYVRNNGVKRNFFDARHWFEKAAAGGNAAAMNNLGLIYEQVHGVPLILGHWRPGFSVMHNAVFASVKSSG